MPKKAKIDTAEELKKINERLGLLVDRTQNDKFLLTHVSQEIQILKSSDEYKTNKIKLLEANPLIKASRFIFSFTEKYARALDVIFILTLVSAAFFLGRIS